MRMLDSLRDGGVRERGLAVEELGDRVSMRDAKP
jgi:hypothetical protein